MEIHFYLNWAENEESSTESENSKWIRNATEEQEKGKSATVVIGWTEEAEKDNIVSVCGLCGEYCSVHTVYTYWSQLKSQRFIVFKPLQCFHPGEKKQCMTKITRRENPESCPADLLHTPTKVITYWQRGKTEKRRVKTWGCNQIKKNVRRSHDSMQREKKQQRQQHYRASRPRESEIEELSAVDKVTSEVSFYSGSNITLKKPLTAITVAST